LDQNYIYFLIKKYYHVWKVGTTFKVCTRLLHTYIRLMFYLQRGSRSTSDIFSKTFYHSYEEYCKMHDEAIVSWQLHFHIYYLFGFILCFNIGMSFYFELLHYRSKRAISTHRKTFSITLLAMFKIEVTLFW
jgi:hypothetical protein